MREIGVLSLRITSIALSIEVAENSPELSWPGGAITLRDKFKYMFILKN